MIKFEVGKVYLSDLSCPELNVSGYVVVVSRTAKFAMVKRHLPNAPVETLRRKIQVNESGAKSIEVISLDKHTRVMAHWAVEKPEEIEKAYRELDYRPQPATTDESTQSETTTRRLHGMKYDYMQASQELKTARNVDELHAVLEKCTKFALQDLMTYEGLPINPKRCKRRDDWQRYVFIELKRIFEAITNGEEVKPRRVEIYNAERNTFEMAHGLGEIVTAWVERKNAETSSADETNPATTAEFDVALERVREGESLPAHRAEPYAEYADEEYSDYAGDNSQPEQDMPEIYTQEEKTMTQTAISDAVIAVKEARTIEAIRDALMTCTVKDMWKVCEEITGDIPRICGRIPKGFIAQRIADFIMRHREAEAFKALTVEEKYAAMMETESGNITSLLHWCGMDELREIVQRLNFPLDEEYADDPDYCAGVVYNGIRALKFERKISEQIANGADKESVKNELKLLPRGIHEALMIRAGINPDVALSREVAIGMLASHFMKCNQPEPQPTPEPEINPDDTSDAEYNMLQICIDASMSARTALKHAMKLLDPKSKDYSVLDELYYCEGREIEEAVERRRVIHKAITTLKEVRARAERQSAVA